MWANADVTRAIRIVQLANPTLAPRLCVEDIRRLIANMLPIRGCLSSAITDEISGIAPGTASILSYIHALLSINALVPLLLESCMLLVQFCYPVPHPLRVFALSGNTPTPGHSKGGKLVAFGH